MKVVIIGAGLQGRSVLAQLCKRNNLQYTFIEHDYEHMKLIQTQKSYKIQLVGNETNVVTMGIPEIINRHDIPACKEHIMEADIILTSTSETSQKDIGVLFGEVANMVYNSGESLGRKNIILCENSATPLGNFNQGLLMSIAPCFLSRFQEEVGICEALSMSIATKLNNNNASEVDILSQDLIKLYINKSLYKGDLPYINGFYFVDHFEKLRLQALYTNNTGSAFIGYLGWLKGYTFLPDAIADQQISALLDCCYIEINQALIKELGVSPQVQLELSRIAQWKYSMVNDSIKRHVRSVIRKLGPKERLVGISNMALRNGVIPDTLALAIASALFYYDETDQETIQLQQMRKEQGISYILENICCIDMDSELHIIIDEKVKWLKTEGLINN